MKILRVISSALLLACSTVSFADSFKSVLVIPVEINSTPFTSTPEEIKELAGKVEEYFGPLEGHHPCHFEIGPTIRITNGKYNSNTAQLAASEAFKTCSRLINMKNYDANVGIIFSGSDIWPHENQIRGSIDNYYFAISEFFNEEKLPLGVFCHEYGHILGLKDLYDTDSEESGGLCHGIWGFLSLMDKGDKIDNSRSPSGLSAVDMAQLKLGICDTLKAGSYNLEPLSRSGRYLYLPSDKSGEYFLLECRAQEGWDKLIGGEGLIVYHVDQSSNKAGHSAYYQKILTAAERWAYNEVNCRPDHPCAMVIEAKPDADKADDIFFPAWTGQSLSGETSPGLRYWSGNGPSLAIKNIRREKDKSVSFDVIEPIREISIQRFQTGALIDWEIDESIRKDVRSCTITLSSADSEPVIINEKLDSDGAVSCYLDGLNGNTYYTAELLIVTSDESYSFTSHFTTLVIDERNTIPFIYMRGAKKNEGGLFIRGSSFTLHVFNSYKAVKVTWSFDGQSISPDEKGKFTVERDGILRAELLYEDGSIDVICKEISVR